MKALKFVAVLVILAIAVPGALRLLDQSRLNGIAGSLRAESATQEHFSRHLIRNLPPTAQRYVRHAIKMETPLARVATLQMTGTIKPNPESEWLPFQAEEILAAGRGFLWRAGIDTPGPFGLAGADYYLAGESQMRFYLAGIIPVVKASGEALSKSAAGRLLIESVMLPTAFLPKRGAIWEDIDEERTKVTVNVDGLSATVTLTIGPNGELREAFMKRYQGGEEGQTGLAPFGIRVLQEARFDGFVLPKRFTAGWHYGTPEYEEFLRATIQEVQFQ
jgi:hypothetical protein